MERAETRRSRDPKVRKSPRVPIQTYRWEDLRRSRDQGGYPWTYLYKQPIDEEVDAEIFTMEALRRSKSSCTMPPSATDSVDIQEISTESRKNSFNTLGTEIITEPDDHSIAKNHTGSVTIEECYEDTRKEPTALESASSSDNISQYLDKEEREPNAKNGRSNETMESTSKANEDADLPDEENRRKRAKSEEGTKRKRKISAESSYSRISLSKLAIMKKLRDAKGKIKVPKLTFAASKAKTVTPKPTTSPVQKKKHQASLQPKPNEKPVYIHIPLKPPNGETDEFSYLEFGEKKEEKKPPLKINPQFKDLLKSVRQLKENEDLEEKNRQKLQSTEAENNTEELESKKEEKEPMVTEEIKPEEGDTPKELEETKKEVTVEEKVPTEEKNKDPKEATEETKPEADVKISEKENNKERKKRTKKGRAKIAEDIITVVTEPITQIIKHMEEEKAKAEHKKTTEDELKAKEEAEKCTDEEHTQAEPTEETKVKDTVKETKPKVDISLDADAEGASAASKEETTSDKAEHEEESEENSEEEPKESIFDTLFFNAGTSKSEKLEPEEVDPRQSRSKSAEPERKRKLSLESSYSRKSLSKLGILKRLKEAGDKIKSTLSRSTSKKETKKPTTEETPKEAAKKKSKVAVPPKDVKPVFIHIPLKPPAGQTDEFSYLEFSDKKPNDQKPEKKSSLEESTPEESPVQNNVQFIFLTPPSDDEILEDRTPDVPDTPSSENMKFFSNKIEELKELAQHVVDEASPDSRKPTLDPVKEESPVSERVSMEEEKKAEESPKKEENMMVDVEDGLSESPVKQEQTQELKSSLKCEASPILKKKVSFKRRSKTPKDGDYEDVQAPEGEKENKETGEKSQLLPLQASQSMSVDEEKTYLDQKIMKDTSLEEDYNKWSKGSDHEYEPINPPDEVTFMPGPPPPEIIASDQDSKRVLPSTTNLENSQLKFDDRSRHDDPERKSSPMFKFHSEEELATHETENVPATVNEKSPQGPSRFQLAFKQKTDQIKDKLHNMKRPSMPHIKKPSMPHIKKPNMPHMPKFKKPEFKKPKINLPKIPDTTRITLPTFNFRRTSTTTTTTTTRQTSTESNDGDSTKKPTFHFGTYPRFFTKKTKSKTSKESTIPSEFATAPRSKKKKDQDVIRIPLHPEESLDLEERQLEKQDSYEQDREDSVERRMMASHIRYDDDIDIDDDYERENLEINNAELRNRWEHGNFNPTREEIEENLKNSQYKVTDLDSPESEDLKFNPVPSQQSNYSSEDKNINTPANKDRYSSEGSVGIHRQGVLEEIDSDEFFLRQKGISQDNIEVGQYLSSEIREAFRTPVNALSQMEQYDPRGSNASLPDTYSSKRKPIKKPKRKKTPHVSQEQIHYDDESIEEYNPDEPMPCRPKRKSKKSKKKHQNDVMPYQQTIPLDTQMQGERLMFPRESLGILGDDERDELDLTYENEQMEGKEQPNIKITDPYKNFEFIDTTRYHKEVPEAPPRKHRSLKSLTVSENDSTLGYIDSVRDETEPNVELAAIEDYIIPAHAPRAPKRLSRTRSRTSSQSANTSVRDLDSPQVESKNSVPCVEEPCVQSVCDYMGYAVVDKNKVREPPLPPPRTPPRRKRSLRSNISESSDLKFSTVPRVSSEGPPVRPLRNYSTLGQIKRRNDPSAVYANKENIDITQYIEIEDDTNRDLQSGVVIQKMRERPLPAPPRPPRKTKTVRNSLQDITSQANIMKSPVEDLQKEILEENVSTQTEPLPDDFVCEEIVQEPSDTVLAPSQKHKEGETVTVERRLITPSHYTHEETVTHAALVVEGLNGAKVLADSQLTKESKERIIPVSREDSDEETSVIPESFKRLKSPPQTTQVSDDLKVLKTQKLHVSDLDVERLTVNELTANKIVVSEIESGSIRTNDISSKTGALRVGEIELPPGLVQDIIRSLKEASDEQKKTPTNEGHREITSGTLELAHPVVSEENEPPLPPPRMTDGSLRAAEETELPQRPPRQSSRPSVSTLELEVDSASRTEEMLEPEIDESISPSNERILEAEVDSCPRVASKEEPLRPETETSSRTPEMLEPEIDEEPPPRPPQPTIAYLPSQPPTSFYALKAQKYVDNLEENIPVVPRRRRHPQRSRPISRSRSSSDESLVPRRPQRGLSDPSIPQLTERLVRACGSSANNSLKRLIAHLASNVLDNADGKQDLNVMMIILLVLIAGLILLGYGDEKTVVHLHHWEYFNPPKDM